MNFRVRHVRRLQLRGSLVLNFAKCLWQSIVILLHPVLQMTFPIETDLSASSHREIAHLRHLMEASNHTVFFFMAYPEGAAL